MIYKNIKFDEKGLVPCITQDIYSKEVLMLAYMNEESLKMTMDTGLATYYSRSRQELWVKGKTSGNIQKVVSLKYDCDGDTALLLVEQTGAACHTGESSCFYNEIEKDDTNKSNDIECYENGQNDSDDSEYSANINNEVENRMKTSCMDGNALLKEYRVIIDRMNNPKEGSYTNYLLNKGVEKICKKIGEESSEIIIAAMKHNKEELIYEISDFLYHVSVLMAGEGVEWKHIFQEIEKRGK